MKKLLFLLPLIALASCNLDNKEAIKETRGYNIANYFVPSDENADPTVSLGSYTCTYYPNKNSMEMSTNNLKAGSSQISFGMSDVNCYFGYAQNGMEAAQFISNSPAMTSGSVKIENLSGVVTPFFYYYSSTFAGQIGTGYDAPLIMMKYDLENLGTVYTFNPNGFYCGETVTEYNFGGASKIYKNDEIIYRVAMDVANNKANLIIYKGRFAEEMPSDKVPEALVLKNLDLTFTRTGYSIKGVDIVPELADASGLTPFDRYKFDSVEITGDVNSLGDIKCSYLVAGMYKGAFSGSCYMKSDTSD